MESIRKIVKDILFCIVFSLSFECLGQNIYNSRTIYYNMDTTRCVDWDARLGEDDRTVQYKSSTDACVFNGKIEIPIVTVNDDKIIRLIDSCLAEATKADYLRFPDSTGYFVELQIFEKKTDSSILGMTVTPYTNYYMAWVLINPWNDAYYEWYGYKEKDLHCCFFRNNILCVVSCQGWLDYERAACLFSQTDSKIRLEIFSPVETKVSILPHDSLCFRHYFYKCDTKEKMN